MESDESPQIKGVVIITLPPPDNPSLGKTITAFTLTNDHPHFHQTHQQELHQTHQEYNLPIQQPPPPSPENPEIQYSSSRLSLGTPIKLLGLVCISLFALLFYSSVFTNTLLDLKDSNDDQEPKSFIFPLYHKFGIREIAKGELQHTLQRVVYKENLVPSVDDVIGTHKINKLASSDAAAVDSSSILPVRGNVYPDGYVSLL